MVDRESSAVLHVENVPGGDQKMSTTPMYESQESIHHVDRMKFRRLQRRNAEDFWRLSLGTAKLEISEVGPGIWATTVSLCRREGRNPAT